MKKKKGIKNKETKGNLKETETMLETDENSQRTIINILEEKILHP